MLPLSTATPHKWHIESIAPAEMSVSLVARWRSFLPQQTSPFLLPEWSQRCAVDNPHVRVAVVELDGQVVGFLPMEARRKLALPVGDRFNDLHGMIQCPESQTVLPIETVLRASRVRSFRFRHWQNPSTSMEPHCWESRPFYYIDLSKGFEAYSESRRGNKRHKLRREIGRLKRKAEAEFGQVTTQWTMDPSVFEQLLRWKQSQATAFGWAPIDLDQVRELAQRLSDGGAPLGTRMVTLRLGDKAVAAEYYLAVGDTLLHAWMRAYDPDFAKFGPGHLLFWESVQQAAEAGVKRIDWGAGEDSFKSKFASGTFPVHSGWADHSRLRSKLRHASVRILKKLKVRDWAKRLRII